MVHLQGGPYIAALHEEIEYNESTQTLSLFMDFYRVKELDRQIQKLRGVAEAES